MVYDDRNVGPGFKFKDADLLGLPLQVVLGERDYKETQKIEIRERKSGAVIHVSEGELCQKITETLTKLSQSLE